ncbi:MAG TPA: hypothetical protein VHM16_00175 [Rubrobacteraceae bacterium]|nr:hypothetical protein [Rubrobacteraceae bacterium]
MLRLTGFLALVLLLCLAGPADAAHAHKPEQVGGVARGHSPESATEIEDPQVSQVFYSELRGPADYRKFTGKRGEEALIQIGVPRIERLRDFRPEAVLIGPALPAASKTLPIEMPRGMGAVEIRFRTGAEPDEFFEPFSMTRSWVAPEYRERLPATGEYYVAVFDPSGTRGKYWLAVGEVERFGPYDWLTLPATLWKVREFHEVAPWPVLIVPAALLAVACVVFFALYKTLFRMKSPDSPTP